MKLTQKDFEALLESGSRWSTCVGSKRMVDDDAYRTVEGEPIRMDFVFSYEFRTYAEVLWARQYLEQEGHEYQVLFDNIIWTDGEDFPPWSITTNLVIFEGFDGPCECKRCKGLM